MSKVKIVTTKENRFGKKVVMPLIGMVEVPKDGVLEVEEKAAAEIINRGIGWEYEDSSLNGVEEEEDISKTEEAEPIEAPEESEPLEKPAKEEVEEEASEEEPEDKLDLSGLTKKELVEVAIEAGMGNREANRMSKAKLIKAIEEKAN